VPSIIIDKKVPKIIDLSQLNKPIHTLLKNCRHLAGIPVPEKDLKREKGNFTVMAKESDR
jgi:hypothetical protein